MLESFPGTVLADTANDGIPDAVKTVLGIAVNDGTAGRSLRPGNGQSIAGTTAPLMLAGGTISQSYNLSLSPGTGSGPFTYTLVSGRLPEGLSLGANGTISGTPGTSGPFEFTYQVTDSQGNSTAVVAQIDVTRTTAVPAMPPWAMGLFGALLLGLMTARERRRTSHA